MTDSADGHRICQTLHQPVSQPVDSLRCMHRVDAMRKNQWQTCNCRAVSCHGVVSRFEEQRTASHIRFFSLFSLLLLLSLRAELSMKQFVRMRIYSGLRLFARCLMVSWRRPTILHICSVSHHNSMTNWHPLQMQLHTRHVRRPDWTFHSRRQTNRLVFLPSFFFF